ncbi:MAG: DUF4760 domain-containing protein [Candidatus Eremiobacteraeota bacterium]|nr:DUF4760 domain-containing protein [Candidatus Eremiobacteraeota bacterium]
MSLDLWLPLASVTISLATVLVTAVLLGRQIKQMDHERNALAILEAIDRLSDPEVISVFERLRGVNERYPSNQAILQTYASSADAQSLEVVGQYVETIACLARRGVLDPSLIVDAVGLMLRTRWATIGPFVARLRMCHGNPYMFENFEWLVSYSAWWKETPRPPKDPNYLPDQFVRIGDHIKV